MPSAIDLLTGQQQSPQPAQTPQQPVNPLMALAAAKQPQQQMPAPNHAQTVAAMHRFGEIKSALMPILDDPKLGSANIRPKLMDAASKMLGSKVLSLTEVMSAIKGLPDDPIAQKKFVENIYNGANKAQIMVLQHHRNAPPQPEDAEQWSPDNHDDNINGLMQHYGGRNG